MDVGFDGADGPAVHHFAGGRRDAARGNFDDRFGGVVDGIESGEQGLDGFRQARELDGDFRDQAEGALRADEKAREIVAGRVESRTSEMDDLAGGQHDFESQHVIGGDAVGQRVRAAGIFGYVAADGAGFLAGRVRRKMQAEMFDGQAEIGVHDAGLDASALVRGIDLENFVHASEGDDDAAAAGERSAGKAGAGAASDKRHIVAVRNFYDFDDLRGGARKDDAIGPRELDRAVIFVED